MKRILSICAFTAVFAACNNNPKAGTDTATTVTTADTATVNHIAFTDKAREVQLNGVSDTIVSNDGSTYVKVKPEGEETAVERPAKVTKERSTVKHTSTHTRKSSPASSGTGNAGTKSDTGSTGSVNSTVSTGTSGTGTTDTTPTTTTTETKKKGWSKAAKGAVIGAGTGAAAGAIISKKKGKGAIIGGIIGGAGGYIIGRNKDKKDGRVQ